ncbi:AraC family transcriptional regulator [Chryseobacterium paridis]|uniref:Helix-turn-helix domain-containing protein n=1 Tax=Chryseobacterium paridis TaxID=2800328 RepID=A0ABS1FZF7_9FLAO|nr:AraC family transcriptional regulator [Chryseobacterium paridis]MBK1897785.1 helix-turn-helix domain-containing protein [Chryseobacterium paridis]
MQSAKLKCGLIEEKKGFYNDAISKDAYVWYEKNWQHDEYEHIHERAQLTYVEEGYQYLHIEQKIYLVPKNHVIWIPSGVKHRTTSEASTVNLMVVLFKSEIQSDFFREVHVFAAPPVLKEMLLYASKWNKLADEDEEQTLFLKALLNSLPNFCNESRFLEIPVPEDHRLIPVCDYINTHFQENLNIDDMADLAKMSVRSLQRIFKDATGITLQKYGQLIRILKSVELIDTRQYTLSEIAFKVGYKSLSAFTSSYTSIMKEGPKVKRENNF